MNANTAPPDEFTPALGARWLTPFYDFAIAGFTREKTWRRALIDLVDPQSDDRILDVGCGTGSLSIALSEKAQVIGVDPDPAVLARARIKARAKNAKAEFQQGFLSPDALPAGWRPTKIVSSLVLHQTPLAEKERLINLIYDLLPPGGLFGLADYGRQPSPVQRFLFKNLVQRVDGFEDTQPNADGALEKLLREAGFNGAAPLRAIKTFTGSISLWRATKSGSAHTD